MGRDKSRTLEWGSANRPKISRKLGSPNPREGSDGDIQVRNTGLGARLFAKLGGRWFSNLLYGSEIDSPDVFIPKAWHYIGKSPAANNDLMITLPEIITHDNILGVSFGINLGAHIITYFGLGGAQNGTSGNIASATAGNPSCEANAMYVHYHTDASGGAQKNQIRVENLSTAATAVAEKDFRLTVFFK